MRSAGITSLGVKMYRKETAVYTRGSIYGHGPGQKGEEGDRRRRSVWTRPTRIRARSFNQPAVQPSNHSSDQSPQRSERHLALKQSVVPREYRETTTMREKGRIRRGRGRGMPRGKEKERVSDTISPPCTVCRIQPMASSFHPLLFSPGRAGVRSNRTEKSACATERQAANENSSCLSRERRYLKTLWPSMTLPGAGDLSRFQTIILPPRTPSASPHGISACDLHARLPVDTYR